MEIKFEPGNSFSFSGTYKFDCFRVSIDKIDAYSKLNDKPNEIPSQKVDETGDNQKNPINEKHFEMPNYEI